MRGILGEDRVVDDPVRTFAFGVDASFYRLNPQVVVRVKDENEVVDTLTVARRHQTPVTFRAAGTSLSGQAITDSVLMKISHNGKAWRRHTIEDGGRSITLEPGRHVLPSPLILNASAVMSELWLVSDGNASLEAALLEPTLPSLIISYDVSPIMVRIKEAAPPLSSLGGSPPWWPSRPPPIWRSVVYESPTGRLWSANPTVL